MGAKRDPAMKLSELVDNFSRTIADTRHPLRAPATNNSCESKVPKTSTSERTSGFFLFAANRRIAAKSPRSTIANSASSGTSVT